MITTTTTIRIRAGCTGCGQWHEYEVSYPQSEEDIASWEASAKEGLLHQTKCPEQRKELK